MVRAFWSVTASAQIFVCTLCVPVFIQTRHQVNLVFVVSALVVMFWTGPAHISE